MMDQEVVMVYASTTGTGTTGARKLSSGTEAATFRCLRVPATLNRRLSSVLHGRGEPKLSLTHATDRSRGVLYTVASLSLIAGLIHLWVMPEHFQEWWGYGTFFLVAAVAQVAYVPLLLRWPSRSVLVLGIVGNSAIVLLYLLTRGVGIPLFGPEAGEIEEVGIIDVCATSSEAAIVVALGALLLWRLARERTALIGVVLSAILLVGAHLPHLLLLAVL
jgi:hypothetical protein